MQFTVEFDPARTPDLSGLSPVTQSQILQAVTAAATQWSWYLTAANITLSIGIRVDANAYGGTTLATGGPEAFYGNGAFDDGVRVYEALGQIKLEGKGDPNGSQYDLHISLTPNAVNNNFFFRPDYSVNNGVPAGKVDALSVMLHEIGHGLGILSFSDSVSDPEFNNARSVWDSFIVNQGTGQPALFGGTNAQATTPSQIVLDNGLSHFSESGTFGRDLMSPLLESATVVSISRLDFAVLRDLGIPVRLATSGDDVLYALPDSPNLLLGDGNDVGFSVPGWGGIMYGEGGDDQLNGNANNNGLLGGPGNDILLGLGGNDDLSGDDGNDQLDGGLGLDKLYGGAGDDILKSGGADAGGGGFGDELYGGDGNDTLIWGSSVSLVDGGAGNDTIDYTARTSGILVDLRQVTTSFLGLENVIGTNFLDTIQGDDGPNRLYGLAGGDNFYGYGGNDFFDGGSGIDIVNVDTAAATIDIAAGTAFSAASGTDTFINIENAGGGSFDDTLLGDGGVNALFGRGGNDTLGGRGGNDTLLGMDGDDILDGGAGNDTLYGGFGNDSYYVEDADTVAENAGEGTDTVFAATSYSLGANVENLTLIASGNNTGTGNSLANVITGNNGNNFLSGGAGNDTLDGGLGTDTASYALSPANNYLVSNGNGSYTVRTPGGKTDTLISIENFTFDGTGQTLSMSEFAAQSFNPLNYIASQSDLLASYGADALSGVQHYMLHGYYEGRTVTFDPLAYNASYGDLTQSFGTDAQRGVSHYLLHGYYEGRAVTFDALAYIASQPDLIPGFGTDVLRGETHYLLHGFYEGRTVTFDPLAYIASQADLIPGFGTDVLRGETHYLLHGFYEGRTVTFDPVSYLLSNSDLGNSGYGSHLATVHYLLHGFYEGRTADGYFTNEPAQHALTLGVAANSSLASGGERDWFSINLSAGQNYNFSMSGADSSNGTLTDPYLRLYNAAGQLLAQDNDSGPGRDSLLNFAAATTGSYYLVAGANTDIGSGSYKIFAATA